MALDLAGMRTEVRDRGFDYLSDSRINQFLNDAMHLINETGDWPYLQTSTTGTAPLTVSDLRKIDAVLDTTNDLSLSHASRGELADLYGDLTLTGSPSYFYVTGGTTVNVFPANSAVSLQVTYWKFGTDLSTSTDTPLMPDRFRYCIVDYAVAAAYMDAGNPQQASAARQAGNDTIARMVDSFGLLQPAQTWVPVVGDDC